MDVAESSPESFGHICEAPGTQDQDDASEMHSCWLRGDERDDQQTMKILIHRE